jgi:hypothetical protein
MVEHARIDLKKKPLHDYICDSAQSEWAFKCSRFLEEFPLKAYCYQYPTDRSYTCWYVSFKDKQNPYIMHFNIYQRGMTIWFRYPNHLSKHIQQQLKRDKNWAIYANSGIRPKNKANCDRLCEKHQRAFL